MSKKMFRIGGFIGSVAVTAALVAAAAGGTGAYFTDTKTGHVYAGTGTVKVDVSNLELSFADLLPGEDKTNTVTYQALGTGSQDIWLVTNNAAVFNGEAGGIEALGRYGHVAVSRPGDMIFESYNLSSRKATDPTGPVCSVDANGRGGSNQQATSTNNADNGSYVPYCAVPKAILLGSNLAYGATGSVDITFGYTKVLKNLAQAGQPLGEIAPFSIVATQHGILPGDVNNP